VRIIIECPENTLHLEAGYIYADCLRQLQTSCSPAADHTLTPTIPTTGVANEETLGDHLTKARYVGMLCWYCQKCSANREASSFSSIRTRTRCLR
jgi:hypothetical protein